MIGSLRLAQLNVAYDDSDITYNDVTQFGLGGGFVSTLTEADCPGGELVELDGRPDCRLASRDDDAYRTSEAVRRGQSVSLFSISEVADRTPTSSRGSSSTTAPSPRRSGRPARCSAAPTIPAPRTAASSRAFRTRPGCPTRTTTTGASVRHRRQRDGRSGQRDLLHGGQPAAGASSACWRCPRIRAQHRSGDHDRAGSSPATRRRSIGRRALIEPLHYGHRFVRTDTEPFTDHDLFVTRHDDCERFASENAKFNPGCEEDVLRFVDGESLVDEDIVVWHRISFHHVPRNEDRHDMHSHWDGFVMQARNLSAGTPGYRGGATGYGSDGHPSARPASRRRTIRPAGAGGERSRRGRADLRGQRPARGHRASTNGASSPARPSGPGRIVRSWRSAIRCRHTVNVSFDWRIDAAGGRPSASDPSSAYA